MRLWLRRHPEVQSVLGTGLVTNHVNFVDTPAGRFAYVSVGARTW